MSILLLSTCTIYADIEIPGIKIDSNGISMSVGNGVTSIKSGNNNVEVSSGDIKTTHSQTGKAYNNVSWIMVDNSNQDFSNRTYKQLTAMNSNLENANLSNSTFIKCTFTNSDFTNANLENATFIKCSITNSDMHNSSLRNVKFIDSDLINIDMDNATLINTTFDKCNVVHVSKENAIYKDGMTQVKNNSVTIEKETSSIAVVKRDALIKSDYISQALSIGKKVDLTINFQFDSAKIKNEARSQIFEIAQALKSDTLKDAKIEIQGHTDSKGGDDYNLDLSYKRALSVMKELVNEYQFASKQFSVKGYGESKPITSNATDEGRAFNRRVTLVKVN